MLAYHTAGKHVSFHMRVVSPSQIFDKRHKLSCINKSIDFKKYHSIVVVFFDILVRFKNKAFSTMFSYKLMFNAYFFLWMVLEVDIDVAQATCPFAYNNTDISGFQIGAAGGTFNECCSICQNFAGCVAWSFLPNTCYLKSSAGPLVAKSGVMVGIYQNITRNI
jgi:hypothetical protein